MITKNTCNKEQIQMVSLEQLVPEDHILRKLDSTIDFSFAVFVDATHIKAAANRKKAKKILWQRRLQDFMMNNYQMRLT